MATSSGQTVAFNPIEETIDHLDGPEEPWSVHLEAWVRGALDDDRLGAAVEAALARHPRARARRVLGEGWLRRRHWWVDSSAGVDPLTVVACDDDHDLDLARADFESLAVPLSTSPPLRVLLAHHPRGDVVMLNVHHAASDGIGALQLLHDIAAAYVNRTDHHNGDGAPESRSETTVGGLPQVPRRRRVRGMLDELRQLLAHSSRLASEGGEERSGYGFFQLALSRQDTAALMGRRLRAVTVNDMLVAALHLSVAQWNTEHGAQSGRVSVLMPVNLRPRERWYQGVGNLACMVVVATTTRDRSSPAAVAAAISRRTAHVKRNASAALTGAVLAKLQKLPEPIKRGIASLLSRGRFVPTALLSNLGSLPGQIHFGDEEGKVTNLWFSPPAQMPLGLSVGALTLEGQLHLCFRYRHPLFGAAAVTRFAACYLEALHAVVGVGEQTNASKAPQPASVGPPSQKPPDPLVRPKLSRLPDHQWGEHASRNSRRLTGPRCIWSRQ